MSTTGRLGDFFKSDLGKMVKGIIKLSLGGFLTTVINNIPATDVTIGGNTVPIGTVMRIIIGFFPIMLLVSAMRDLDVF